MYESFWYSINTIVPLLILSVLGAMLFRRGFLGKAFFEGADRLVFHAALPCLLFSEMIASDLSSVFDGRLTTFCVIATLLCFSLLCLFSPLFLKSRSSCGAFVQGFFRGNFAILGIPLAQNLFGEEGQSKIIMLMPFAVVLFNLCAVVALALFAPREQNMSVKLVAKEILVSIVQNPLILSMILGLIFLWLRIPVPVMAERTLSYIGDLAAPLALLSLGASFRPEHLRRRFRTALAAAIGKTLILPAAALVCAVILGFRGISLGMILLWFGTPASVSSYIMTKQMHGDSELSAQILILTTIICVFTLFIGIFVLQWAGLLSS